jgi:hypothetical protein
MSKLIIEHLERRIHETELEYQEVFRQRAELMHREQELQKELRAYKVAIQCESRRIGVPLSEKLARETLEVKRSEESGGYERGKIGLAILNYLKGAGERGLTYKQIAQMLIADGIKAHRNYPYVVVGKLKDAGDVKDVNGKLVWQVWPGAFEHPWHWKTDLA